ncbi:MAG: hypothetical protein KDA79_22740, partial [Planctomycetaceae bacterium]|nr:hypothetical protein [Planctomycetaceae bacterium]
MQNPDAVTGSDSSTREPGPASREPDRSPAEGGCPLPWPAQRRNLMVFAGCTGLQYFAAPVLYVGITQASLCDRLGADARTSN